MNGCIQETDKDGKRKDHCDPKRLISSNRPQQLQTHNVPIDDVENSNIIQGNQNVTKKI